jgi:hypothetical protein
MNTPGAPRRSERRDGKDSFAPGRNESPTIGRSRGNKGPFGGVFRAGLAQRVRSAPPDEWLATMADPLLAQRAITGPRAQPTSS